jgi:hypothetical protein
MKMLKTIALVTILTATLLACDTSQKQKYQYPKEEDLVGRLQWPLNNFSVTQKFGENKGQRYGPQGHFGLDMAESFGAPVKAAADGIVVAKGTDECPNFENSYCNHGMGNWIMLWHPDLKIHTVYSHLKEKSSKAIDENVCQGETIGNEGGSGSQFYITSGPEKPITGDPEAHHLDLMVGIFKTFTTTEGKIDLQFKKIYDPQTILFSVKDHDNSPTLGSPYFITFVSAIILLLICVLLGWARVELVAVQKTRVLDKAEEERRKIREAERKSYPTRINSMKISMLQKEYLTLEEFQEIIFILKKYEWEYPPENRTIRGYFNEATREAYNLFAVSLEKDFLPFKALFYLSIEKQNYDEAETIRNSWITCLDFLSWFFKKFADSNFSECQNPTKYLNKIQYEYEKLNIVGLTDPILVTSRNELMSA